MKNIIKMSSLDELLDTSSLPCPCVASFKDGEDEYVLYRDLNGNDDFFKNGDRFDPLTLKYFCLESLEDENAVAYNFHGADVYVDYSLDGKTWASKTTRKLELTLNKGERVYIKSKNPYNYDENLYARFTSSKRFNISGNVLSLTNEIVYSYGFYNLFENCSKLVDASGLIMPRFMNPNSCNSMFKGCTSLVGAPKLPATTLGHHCYYKMFQGCSSLVNAPELPATTLKNYCYSDMFYGCVSLEEAPYLPAENPANYSYLSMFYGCSNLKKVSVGAKSWSNVCSQYWLSGVSSTGTFTKPASTEIPSGESGIPNGWTVINK